MRLNQYTLISAFFILSFTLGRVSTQAQNAPILVPPLNRTNLKFITPKLPIPDKSSAKNQLFEKIVNSPPSLKDQNKLKASGTESGGGGAGRICVNPSNTEISVDLLDHLEARQEIHPDVSSAKGDLEILNRVLNKVNTIDPIFGSIFKREIETLPTIWKWTNFKTTTPYDLGITDKNLMLKNCYFAYIGFYVDGLRDTDDTLKVDPAAWALLSDVDRAMFVIHEVLYKMARRNQHTVLAHVIREATSELLSLSDISVFKAARFFRPSSYSNSQSYLNMSWSGELKEKKDPRLFLKPTDRVEFNILSLTNRLPPLKKCIQPRELSLSLDLCVDFSNNTFFVRTYFCAPLIPEETLPTIDSNKIEHLNRKIEVPYANYLKVAEELDQKLQEENSKIYYSNELAVSPYYFKVGVRSKNSCSTKSRSSLVASEDVHVRPLILVRGYPADWARRGLPLYFELGDQSRLKKETNIQIGVDLPLPESLENEAYSEADVRMPFLVRLRSN